MCELDMTRLGFTFGIKTVSCDQPVSKFRTQSRPCVDCSMCSINGVHYSSLKIMCVAWDTWLKELSNIVLISEITYSVLEFA